jgi:recombination protein RecR
VPQSILEKLALFFERFPGIGPRQAARFVYHLIDEDKSAINEFMKLLGGLEKAKHCENCFQVFESREAQEKICRICADKNRDKTTVLVVEKDLDLKNIEKTKSFDGLYYVLGGVMSPLNSGKSKNLKLKELFERAKNSKEIKEIILGLSATVEGETTSRYIEKILEPLQKERELKMSRLARGLTTGAELEYMDSETIKNSLLNRK